MIGKINSVTFSQTGNPVLMLEMKTKEILRHENLFNTDLDIAIKKHSEKRSLNANAFAWTLMAKIAEAITPPLSKEEVYRKMLIRYGTMKEDSNGTQILFSIRDDVDLRNTDEYLYIHAGAVGKGEINGCSFIQYRLIKGSSEYTKTEMARFLDGIIQECEQLGIPTITGNEYSDMLDRWEKQHAKHYTG